MHARCVAAAAIDGVTGELVQAKLTPSHDHIRSWVQALPGPVAVTYEAGPTGFDLYRALTAAGVRCEVAAPSKLQKPSGERVKTDAKDAIHLARLLRLDEVTSVAIPSVDQEAARDLVRAREDCRGDESVDPQEAFDLASDSWLHSEAAAYDGLKADPSKAIPAETVRASFEAKWAARL